MAVIAQNGLVLDDKYLLRLKGLDLRSCRFYACEVCIYDDSAVLNRAAKSTSTRTDSCRMAVGGFGSMVCFTFAGAHGRKGAVALESQLVSETCRAGGTDMVDAGGRGRSPATGAKVREVPRRPGGLVIDFCWLRIQNFALDPKHLPRAENRSALGPPPGGQWFSPSSPCVLYLIIPHKATL